MKVFLWFTDNDFDFLKEVRPYCVEPNEDSKEGVEIPDELWEQWKKVSAEFLEVQQKLAKFVENE